MGSYGFWCDSPSTLMTPRRCSSLTAPQHNRMMTMVCRPLSRCSRSIPTTSLTPVNLGNFELWNKLNLNVWLCLSASLFSNRCPEALFPFYLHPHIQLDQHSPASLCLCLLPPFCSALWGIFYSIFWPLLHPTSPPPNFVLPPVGQSLCPSLYRNIQ